MEDFKVLIYVLLAVGYFLFNFFRKNFKDDPAQPKKFRDENAPPVERPHHRPPVPVTSFEDILRELQPKVEQAKAQVKEVVQRPVPQLVEVPAPKAYSYEKTQFEAVSLERTMPERTIKKRPDIGKHEAFQAYTMKPTTTLRKFDPSILRNPTTARDAFVLSEIFNRKY